MLKSTFLKCLENKIKSSVFNFSACCQTLNNHGDIARTALSQSDINKKPLTYIICHQDTFSPTLIYSPFLHIVLNSLTLHNLSSESATSAVSPANKTGFGECKK